MVCSITCKHTISPALALSFLGCRMGMPSPVHICKIFNRKVRHKEFMPKGTLFEQVLCELHCGGRNVSKRNAMDK